MIFALANLTRSFLSRRERDFQKRSQVLLSTKLALDVVVSLTYEVLTNTKTLHMPAQRAESEQA